MNDKEYKGSVIFSGGPNCSQKVTKFIDKNDLIVAAYNNAKENLKKKSAEELSKATGGLDLPSDFKLPF